MEGNIKTINKFVCNCPNIFSGRSKFCIFNANFKGHYELAVGQNLIFNYNEIVEGLKLMNDDVLDSINLLMLSFLKSYDQSYDRRYLDLANKLSQIIYKNSMNDIDLINSKQIKFRQKNSSFNNKKVLNTFSEKL